MPVFKKNRTRNGGAAAAASAVENRANEVFPHAQPSQHTGRVNNPRPPPQRLPAAEHQPPQQISLVPLVDGQVQRMAAPSPAHLGQLTPMVPPPMSSPMPPISAVAMQQQQRQHPHPRPSPYPSAAPPPVDATAYVAVGPTLVPVGDAPPRSSRASTGMPLDPTRAPAPVQARYDRYEQPYLSGYEQQQGVDYINVKPPPACMEEDGDHRGTDEVVDGADDVNQTDDDNDDEDCNDSDDGDDDDDDDDLFLPLVTEAADDVWRNDADDFVGAAEALRILTQAIVAAAEDEDEDDENGDGAGGADDGREGEEGSNGLRSEVGRRHRHEEERDVYDPSDIFLCIQGAALRYHATWVARVEERQMRASETSDVDEIGNENKGDDTSSNFDDADIEDVFAKEENSSTTPADVSTVGQYEKLAEEGEGYASSAQVSDSGAKEVEVLSDNNLAALVGKDEALVVATHEGAGGVSDHDSRSSDENWEEGEQAAWDVWEAAIGAAAALATTCVGPAWQSQIRQRRRWLANGRTDLITRRSTSMMSDQQDDGMSVSTVGMGSVAGAAWQAQEQAHMAQLLGQNFRQSLGGTPELEEVTDNSMGSNPQAGGRSLFAQGDEGVSTPGTSSAGGRGDGDFSSWNNPIIPEVLPAAMLRFAASVSEMAVPPLRTPDSIIRVEGTQSHTKRVSKPPKTENEDDEGLESTAVDDVVGRVVWEAQRWLVRRQRVGNAQRDLVLALCCEALGDDGENSSQVTGIGTRSGQQRSPSASVVSGSSNYRNGEGPQWTIVGAHIPVASMLATWIETAKAGWPTQRSSINPASVDRSDAKDLAWSRVAKVGAVDWWYVLQVSRASTDLVTVGWRPPPRGSAGENCIKGLLDIARRGLVLSSRDFKSSRRSFDQDAREERLAAASSSAEALSTLANIGSRGFLPLPTVSTVAKGLCSLLASIDPTMSNISVSSLYPLPRAEDEDEDVALVMEKEAFFFQRESCVADIAELLWSLLAHGASTCPAVEALLQFIELHVLASATYPDFTETKSPSSATLISSTASATASATETTATSVSPSAAASASTSIKSLGSNRGDKKSVLAAAGAIRACGAAFWGDPPQVKGVGSLRIFWNQLLLLLARISSSIRCPRDFHDVEIKGVDSKEYRKTSTHTTKSDQAEHAKSVGVTVDTKAIKHGPGHQTICLCEQTQPFLVVILEVAVALRRLTDGELIQHIDALAPDEWESFLDALETLVEWLDARLIVDHPKKCRAIKKQNKFLLRRIIAEIRAIFDQTEAFLTRGGIDGNFHCIVDDEYRKKLHTLMLRAACPLLQPAHATNVALSVVRSWAWGGYYLNRGDLWYTTASDVLGDAFSMFDQESFGFRGYVHAPSVRREALLAVSRRYGDLDDSHANKQRTPSRGASRRASTDEKNYTPAALVTKVHEMQVERICPFFLPYLHEILLPSTYSDLLKNTSRVVIEVPSSLSTFASQKDEPIPPTGIGAQVMDLESEKYDDTSNEDRALVEKTITDEFRLRKSAVRILGRLLRILTSDRRIRQTIILILRDVAKSFCTFQTTDFPVFTDLSPLFSKAAAKVLIAQELFYLSAEAIRQLGESLEVPFGARPLTHWVCGEILDALSTFVQDVQRWPNTNGSDPMTNLPIDATSRKVLVLFALMPMARIRISHDTRAVMTSEALMRSSVGAKVMSAIDEKLATEPDVKGDDNDNERQVAGALPVFFDQYEQRQSLRSDIAPFVFVRMPNAKTKEICAGEDTGDSKLERNTPSRTGTTISLDNMLSSIETLLVSHPHSAANINPSDAQHRSAIIDVGAEEVDVAIKVLSCNTLHELMLCGLPVKFTLQIPPSTSSDEAKARNRAISSFACFAAQNDPFENCDAKICTDELVTMFNKSNFVAASDACRGTLSLLASALLADDLAGDGDISSSDAKGGDQKELWSSLCNQLIDRLHSFLDDQGAPYGATSQMSDPSVPLLSTIYDVFTLSRTTPFVPPESVRLRTVLVCLRLSSQSCQWISLQGKVLALQCAGSVIRIMNSNEAQMVLNESMWDMHPVEISGINEDCFESLIVDLLVRRYLASKHVDRSNSSSSNEQSNNSKERQLTAEFTSHESLAKETIDIDNFPVEKDDRATAAWLCGDTLLMCRLGDSKSRHRGWIEVTVRSPTCRLRRLVRLPLCNSIAHPDFPSSLWSLTRSLNKSYQAPSCDKTTDATAGDGSLLAVGAEIEGTLNGSTSISDNSGRLRTKSENDSANGINKTAVVGNESLRCNSQALDKANAVVRRFEATPNIDIHKDSVVLEPKDAGVDFENALEEGSSMPMRKEEEGKSAGVPVSNGKLDTVAMRKELDTMRSEMEDMIVTGRIRKVEDKRPENKHFHSADNLPPNSAVDDGIPLSKDAETMTAHGWLKSILGRSTKNIDRVKEELFSLGFPDSVIGSTSAEDDNRSHTAVIHRVFERWQRLQSGPKLARAVGLLDRTACSLQTHKIALLIAGPGSVHPKDDLSGRVLGTNEDSVLLRSPHGSPEFIEFSRGLGAMVMTRHLKYFSGGLDTSAYLADGSFALAYVGDDDDCQGYDGSVTAKTMVLFHSVPLMPPGVNNRKRHVGNDVVHLIFAEKDNEAVDGFGRIGKNYDYEEDFDDRNADVSGEFGFVWIIVSPSAGAGLTRVTVKAKADLDEETHAAVSHLLGTSLFPKDIAARCVRQLAIRADIACRSTKAMQDRLGLVSNYEERLHQIKKLSRHSLHKMK